MKFVESMLRLYAVTDRSWPRGLSLTQQVEQAIKGGASCVQLREKELEYRVFLEEAYELRSLCSRYGVPFIINDNVSIALEVDADGVHVGQEDMSARDVRTMIGKDKILGVTAKTVRQALDAQEAGADYLGSGAVFGSSTKRNTLTMPMETLSQICNAVEIPVVAIGGISRANIVQLKDVPIRGAAVVSGIFAAGNIEEESRALRGLIERIVEKRPFMS